MSDATTPKYQLGLNPDMPNKVYHEETPGISKSMLDKIADCPAKFFETYLNPDREPLEKTDALVVGDAIHHATLQPDTFGEQYLIMPEFNARSTAGRAARDEWLASEAKGKDVLTLAQRDLALSVARAVHKHPVASRLIAKCRMEQSFFAIDPETGELVKCRTDAFNFESGGVVDLKSTDDASPSGFAKSMTNYRYVVQQPWYEDVIENAVGAAPDWWAWLAVEKKPPYAIGIYYLEQSDVDLGRRLARRDLHRVIECRRTNQWPDYATEARPLKLPSWWRSSLNLPQEDLL